MNDKPSSLGLQSEHFHQGWAAALRSALELHQQNQLGTEEILGHVKRLQQAADQVLAEIDAIDKEPPVNLILTAHEGLLKTLRDHGLNVLNEQRGGLEQMLKKNIERLDEATRLSLMRAHDEFLKKGKHEAEALRNFVAQQSEQMQRTVEQLVAHAQTADLQRQQLIAQQQQLVSVLQDDWFARLIWVVAGRRLSKAFALPRTGAKAPEGQRPVTRAGAPTKSTT